MYIDKDGVEHPDIHLLMEDTEKYLKGWYFEDERNCFYNDDPFNTMEEAEEAKERYFAPFLKRWLKHRAKR